MAARAFAGLWMLVLAAGSATGQSEGDIYAPRFPVGKTVERPLAGDETHVYGVELKRGEVLRLDLKEKGVNCILAVALKDEVIVDFGDGFGRETITYVAKDAAPHAILVIARKGHAGAYSLTGAVKPSAGRAEQQRAQVIQSMADAMLMHSVGGVASADAALQRLERAVEVWQELGDDYWAGYTATLKGKIFFEAGRMPQAFEQMELALNLFSKAGDKQGRGLASYNLGSYYRKAKREEDALRYYLDALEISKEIGHDRERVLILTAMADVHAGRGSRQLALGYYEDALRVLKDVKSPELEGSVLARLGWNYARTGEVDKALSSLNRASALAKQAANPDAEAAVLNDIADLYSQTGELQQALAYSRQALNSCLKSGNRRCQAEVLSNTGEIYASIGERREALAHLEKAAAIYKEMGDALGAAHVLTTAAKLNDEVGDVERGDRGLREARELLKGKESDNPQTNAYLLLQEGDVFNKRGDSKAAAAAYAEAVRISSATGDPSYAVMGWIGLAGIYFKKGEIDDAHDAYCRSLFAASAYGDPEMESWALEGLLMTTLTLKYRQLAILFGKEAINKTQELRTRLRGLEGTAQKSFLRKSTHAYAGVAQLLVLQKRYAEALRVINAFHDQQFYDFNRDPQATARQIPLTSREAAFSSTFWQMIRGGVALHRQVAVLKQRAGARPSPEEAREIARLDESIDKFEQGFANAVWKAANEFSRNQPGDEAAGAAEDLKEMQALLRELSTATAQKTVAVYTLVGAGGVAVLLVTPDSVTAGPLVADDRLDEKVLQYHALLQTPSLDPRPLGKKLYDLIVKPVEPALRAAGARTLLWSLGGTLRYVPMASLWDGERYLVERYGHAVFTRADRGRMTRAVSRNWTGTGFGSSREQTVDLLGDGDAIRFRALPGVTRELRSIFRVGGTGSGVLAGEVLTDTEFTKAAFYASVKRRRPLVHISSHFSFRPGDDTRSFMLLGDGTALTLNEMKQHGGLFDGVELLTLSACNTAAAQTDAYGKEIDGFAELAQRLGASSVMATLWQVSDDSTPWLMKEFYATRQSGEGLTKAAALRNAQLALLRGAANTTAFSGARRGGGLSNVSAVVVPGAPNQVRDVTRADVVYVSQLDAPLFKHDDKKRYAHPYYWSPFVIFGNWR